MTSLVPYAFGIAAGAWLVVSQGLGVLSIAAIVVAMLLLDVLARLLGVPFL